MGVKQPVQEAQSSSSPVCFHVSECEWRTFHFFSTFLINQPTSQQRPFKGLKPQAIKFSRLMLCYLSLRESLFKLTKWNTKQSKKSHVTIISYTYIAPSVPKDFRALYGLGKVKFCHLFNRTQQLVNCATIFFPSSGHETQSCWTW